MRFTKSQKNFYHHIGLYVYSSFSLKKFVNLKQTFNEVDRSLEQMRAFENYMRIHVGFVNSKPLSVDTEQDYIKVKELMEKDD